MMEQLPISIYVCDDLIQQFSKITSICNKLEAQFNFQTMTANWYGDEDNIFFVRLFIETPESFITQKKNQKQVQPQYEIHNYCDDVFSYCASNEIEEQKEKKQMLICYIAITDTELTMLNQQNKLLAGLLRVKLQKVLNLIAKQLNLETINCS